MSRPFYHKIRKHRIFAAISEELKVVFVGKSYAESLYSVYSRHSNGRNYLTAEYFGKSPPRVKPDILILEELSCTGAEAYKHIVAWCKYFDEQGFLNLTQSGTQHYSEALLPETEEIFKQISKEPLERVLLRKYTPQPPAKRVRKVQWHPEKPEMEKLSLRLKPQELDTFLELCKGCKLTYREGFAYLLENISVNNPQSLLKQKQQRIETLREEVEELKVRLAKAREDTRSADRTEAILARAKNVLYSYLQNILPECTEEALKPVRMKHDNNFHDFSYPKEAGCMVVILEKLIYGNSKGLLFVLGFDQDGQPVKFRFYAKKDFLGMNPNSSRAVKGSRWLMHYKQTKDGAMELSAALPLPPKPETKTKTETSSLEELIREIEQRK